MITPKSRHSLTIDRSSIDPSKEDPLYLQIYNRIRSAIAEGLLKPGDRIAPARTMAAELGLARGTVIAAYNMLASEGYIQSRGQAGTIVTPGIVMPPVAPVDSGSAAPLDEPDMRRPRALPFQIGLPALDAFPRKIWSRLGSRRLRSMKAWEMDYPFPLGLYELRCAIAAYLRVVRGINCTPAQVIVTSGYWDTLRLIAQSVLKPNDQVWVENPGYPATRHLLSRMKARLVPVPVDAEGLVVSAGLRCAPDARVAVVTPAHQSPLCVTLSLPRRLKLLDWAARTGAWIVEDDYDGEYRYASRPLPALKSLDEQGRVLYAGTFSKVMFPGLRLAYLVVPNSLIEPVTKAREIYPVGISEIGQSILANFMDEGHFVRHIHMMRNLYSERREATAGGLDDVLGKRVFIQPQPGGMHLVLRLQEKASDKTLAERMRANGMYAQALSDWAMTPIKPGLLLGFTNIQSRDEVRGLAKRMLALM